MSRHPIEIVFGTLALLARAATGTAGASTRYYQNWYRSRQTFCTASTSNLTNAVRIDWTL